MGWITKNGNRIYIDDGDDLYSALSEHYGKTKLPTVYLEKQEYAHVMSEINTWYKKEYAKKRIIRKAIGDYIYTFENNGYNDYRIINKARIDGDD